MRRVARATGLNRSPVAVVAAVGMLAMPAAALAHPLGNFTINHYAGIRVSPTEIRLDVVLDRAEIPTFEERRRLDADADGELSDREMEAAREPGCRTLARDLELTVAGRDQPLTLAAAGLSLPPGAGGLSTMRLVCEFIARVPIREATPIAFVNVAFADQPGWREIVVRGDGVTITTPPGRSVSADDVSGRLTEYPPALLARPLSVREVAFVATPGGPPLDPFTPPDAARLDASAGAGSPPATPAMPAAVPGGVGDFGAAFGAADLTPVALLVAVATALGLGAGHAVTPGHGKTVMAAYLVGTRGTPTQALALALAVAVSHTLGVLVLAAIVLAAGRVLPAGVLVRTLPVVAALAIVAVGVWMLAAELGRRRSADRAPDDTHRHDPHAAAPKPSWRALAAVGLAGGIVPSTGALLILLATIAASRPAFGVLLVAAYGVGMAAVLGGIGLVAVHAGRRIERIATGRGVWRATRWVRLAAACAVVGLGLWLTVAAVVRPPSL